MAAATESVALNRGEPRDLDRRFEINVQHVAAELINDELVVINFYTGKYHGVRGDGVAVWRLLEAGLSENEVVTRLARSHIGFDDRAARAVGEFVSELEKQELIVPSPRSAPALDPSDFEGNGHPFAAPELDTRDDLQDYLALDPIHDVDERGWPNARR